MLKNNMKTGCMFEVEKLGMMGIIDESWCSSLATPRFIGVLCNNCRICWLSSTYLKGGIDKMLRGKS